jgi:hypothetical protein
MSKFNWNDQNYWSELVDKNGRTSDASGYSNRAHCIRLGRIVSSCKNDDVIVDIAGGVGLLGDYFPRSVVYKVVDFAEKSIELAKESGHNAEVVDVNDTDKIRQILIDEKNRALERGIKEPKMTAVMLGIAVCNHIPIESVIDCVKAAFEVGYRVYVNWAHGSHHENVRILSVQEVVYLFSDFAHVSIIHNGDAYLDHEFVAILEARN